MMTWYLRLRL